jgi:hypothetical protein
MPSRGKMRMAIFRKKKDQQDEGKMEERFHRTQLLPASS